MLPYKWNNYFAHGTIIKCINTICFKLPCNGTEWDICKLINTFPNLKIVIDFRYSETCYNPSDLNKLGIEYIKIPIKAQSLPTDDKINKFFNIIDKYIELKYLIGIHCTHGINRTGYMVCKYLIYKFKIPPYVAINIFEKNRGYYIEREIYINNLLYF
ncbi:protein tyrosine phosphatase 1 [Betaentomopoxvirus amoorei]|uniref:AMV246 n=1 Tax=Amsacta moorei entomopoxvirus TaxID=28321 RepID=Q9EMG0_AMEPV|nr:protein tyrosine phosphatase 1 [Amsacta moorei entomopoxvirus]AAG02952.1 AMV246 [Amsacta moorei entomopoxvirus]